MKKRNYRGRPVIYATYYGYLKTIARRYGYALALHGSLCRDMDLIAVPWIENPKSHDELLTAIHKKINPLEYKIFLKSNGVPYATKSNKPNGRIAYTINIGGGGYLDISILPIIKDKE